MVRVASPIGTAAVAGLAAGTAVTAGTTGPVDGQAATPVATDHYVPADGHPAFLHPLAARSHRPFAWAMPLASLAIAASALMACGGDLLPPDAPTLALGIWGGVVIGGHAPTVFGSGSIGRLSARDGLCGGHLG